MNNETKTEASGKDVGMMEKQVIYQYSNILVCVFASVVLGELVEAEDMGNKESTDKLIVRLDTLGWLPAMHDLGQSEEFCKLVNEMVDEGRPWVECLSSLSHLVLYLYDGVEGLARKRDAAQNQLREEARSGLTKKEVIEKVIERLIGKEAVEAAKAAAEGSGTGNGAKATIN